LIYRSAGSARVAAQLKKEKSGGGYNDQGQEPIAVLMEKMIHGCALSNIS